MRFLLTYGIINYGDIMTNLQKCLFEMQDLKYRDFHARLMPTVDNELIIGIRTPMLRSFADQYAKTSLSVAFLRELPHRYYEENNLHAFIIEKTRDFDTLIAQLDEFLPYVDNWATCDMMAPKLFAKNRTALLPHIRRWIHSDHLYTIRFGIVTLMKHFLDEDFSLEYLDLCANVPTDEYYLSMAVAWFFATALAKQWDLTIPYITEMRLDSPTHNRTIRKAIESFRISDDRKTLLSTFKV